MPAFLRLVLCAISVCGVTAAAENRLGARGFVSGTWTLSQQGTTGVAGQQLAVVSETTAIIYDKVEHNPLQTNGHLAWSVEYDLVANTPRALNPKSNSWCASGAHLSNGTFVSTGGNPLAGAGDVNGLQGIRLFDACSDKTCDVFEDPAHLHLTSNRWYPSSARLDDGSIIIFGGSQGGGFINGAGGNNPSYEFFPPKNINGHNGVQIPSQFMRDTLNGNHFPVIFSLPDGTLFVAANTQAMIFNWRTNTETRLPNIPNGVRITSPFSASAALLPLVGPNYTPTVLICGGSTVSDSVPANTLSSQTPATNQCSRMTLDAAGIARGWEVEHMPQARVMPELILLPDGRILLVNGAQTGVAGYGNVGDKIGQSNADHPAFQPAIYDPAAASGSRFSTTGMPTSTIARLYHSVASLTPNGTILLAGSNPNDDVTTTKYPTEYRVEHLMPAYLSQPRPTYTGQPAKIAFGANFTLNVQLPSGVTSVTVALVDLGFATHGVHMDQRLVYLTASLSASRTTLTVTAPPSALVYPPGPGYLYVVTSAGVPSFGRRIIVGSGAGPPVNQAAISNMITQTKTKSAAPPPKPAVGEGSHIPTEPIPAPP